jgi:hypothetical protein
MDKTQKVDSKELNFWGRSPFTVRDKVLRLKVNQIQELQIVELHLQEICTCQKKSDALKEMNIG